MNFDKILEYLIPLASVMASYILGRVQSWHTRMLSANQERYLNFYVPFISTLYQGYMWKIPFSNFSLEGRGKIFDLVMKNIQYLDTHTQAYIPEFYKCYLDVLEFENGNVEYSDAPEKLDHSFIRLTESVLSESKKLSKSLQLPPIGKSVGEYFHQVANEETHKKEP